MQAFIVLKDSFGGEVRLPVNVSIPVPDVKTEPKLEPKPEVKPGHGRWNKAYSPEFRARALELGQLVGPCKAAKFLGIPDSTIDNWVRNARKPKTQTMTGVTAWSMS